MSTDTMSHRYHQYSLSLIVLLLLMSVYSVHSVSGQPLGNGNHQISIQLDRSDQLFGIRPDESGGGYSGSNKPTLANSVSTKQLLVDLSALRGSDPIGGRSQLSKEWFNAGLYGPLNGQSRGGNGDWNYVPMPYGAKKAQMDHRFRQQLHNPPPGITDDTKPVLPNKDPQSPTLVSSEQLFNAIHVNSRQHVPGTANHLGTEPVITQQQQQQQQPYLTNLKSAKPSSPLTGTTSSGRPHYNDVVSSSHKDGPPRSFYFFPKHWKPHSHPWSWLLSLAGGENGDALTDFLREHGKPSEDHSPTPSNGFNT